MAQEPFPIVLNDENGRVIAVDGKSIEKLEDELPVGLGPNKRQKLDD